MDVTLVDEEGKIMDAEKSYALDLSLFTDPRPWNLGRLLKEWGHVVFHRDRAEELLSAWAEFYEAYSPPPRELEQSQTSVAAGLDRINSLIVRWGAGEGHRIEFLGE